MKQLSCQFTASTVIITIFVFISFPVLSNQEIKEDSQPNLEIETHSDDGKNFLNKARIKLENAFASYGKGDIVATKRQLKIAVEWLNKAAQKSKAEKVRKEAGELAIEINKFKEEISQASGQKEKGLVSFWHRTTSIIKRKADQLINYADSSIFEKTLKYFLDAKIHLFTAEHDLFISRDAKNSGEELTKVLDYLNEASQITRPAIHNRVVILNKNIQLLKENIATNDALWKNNNVIHGLDNALRDLVMANENASSGIKLRIKLLETDIRALRIDVGKSNVKNDYDSAMVTLKSIINDL